MSDKLTENVMHFGRLLRRAGLPVGPAQVCDAVEAVSVVNVHDRSQFYWALAAVFVKRREHLELFAEAFATYWKDPWGADQLLSMMLDKAQRETTKPQTKRRIQEAWSAPVPVKTRPRQEDLQEERVDTVVTFAADEVLRTKDFEQMTAEEITKAKLLIQRMRFDVADLLTRRRKTSHRGPIDLRRTMKQNVRSGGDLMPLSFYERRKRPPTLVILCDISGSMERYSRMFLHFMHVLTNHRDRAHAFTFGTRLSNVTRTLEHKDVDIALEKLGQEVVDWSGGTRIRSALSAFNKKWSRRVLGQGAIVLLVTDGLDRDLEAGLDFEVQRLRRSCRRLIWLNPLLRFDGFQPLASGVKVLFRHAHEHRPVHDLASLESLVRALATPGRPTA